MVVTPTCKRCGAQHYNFALCPVREDYKPPISWHSKEKWGNRMIDLVDNGSNTFLQKRSAPIRSTRITLENDEEME